MDPQKKELTRQEILQAAKKLVYDRGHEAVTVRRLAERTGYSYTSMYYYFRDLEDLLWTLRLEMIQDMIETLSGALPQKDEPVEEFLTALCVYADYFLAHPAVFRFFYFRAFTAPTKDDRYTNMEFRFQNIWASAFARLVQENILPPEDVETTAKAIIYALQGMLTLCFSANGSLDSGSIRGELEKLIHLLLRSAARPAQGGPQ